MVAVAALVGLTVLAAQEALGLQATPEAAAAAAAQITVLPVATVPAAAARPAVMDAAEPAAGPLAVQTAGMAQRGLAAAVVVVMGTAAAPGAVVGRVLKIQFGHRPVTAQHPVLAAAAVLAAAVMVAVLVARAPNTEAAAAVVVVSSLAQQGTVGTAVKA